MTLHDALIQIARKEGVPGTAEHFASVMVPYFEEFGRAVHRKSRDFAGYFDVAGADDESVIAGIEALRALVGD